MESSAATDLMRSHPEAVGDLLLSRATTQSTTCVVATGEKASGAERGVNAAEARAASWLLGISLGRDAVVRQLSGSDPRVLEASVAQMSRFAEALGVPAPVFLVPAAVGQRASRVRPVRRGRREPDRSSARGRLRTLDCELYKLGAFWAYSAAVRVVLPDRQLTHDAEIRHHAHKAALPESLCAAARGPAGCCRRQRSRVPGRGADGAHHEAPDGSGGALDARPIVAVVLVDRVGPRASSGRRGRHPCGRRRGWR